MGARLLGDGCEKRFSPEDFYLYLCAHEYKHYVHAGTGLRSLLDACVYLRGTELDMDYVVAEARKMGIADFEDANRSLALRLFSGQELTDADREMLGCIMFSGVYGTVGQRMGNGTARSGCGKLRYALYRFLGPLSESDEGYDSYADRYPLFYGHKALRLLLPFYRVLRAIWDAKV